MISIEMLNTHSVSLTRLFNSFDYIFKRFNNVPTLEISPLDYQLIIKLYC